MAEKTLEQMREAVEEIRAKMAAAAREAGRDPAQVQLCAACKTRTAETVAASAALPIDVFGENHVQELCANFDAGAYCGKPSHFIGHLQTNKIKKVLGRASLIQSVDSEHLLAADVHLQQHVLHDTGLGGFLLDGIQQMLTVHALDEAGAAQHLFDLVGLQMADKVAGLTAVGTGVKVCAQLLHMVLAKHIDGQSGTCGHRLCSAGLAGGAQLDLGRVAACLPGSSGHLFTDGQHGLPHLFRCFFCHKASVLLGIFCTLSADELRAGAGAENVCFTDPVQAQPHRHGHPAQVHPDQGAADVDTGVGADLLHSNGVFELLPRCV